MRRTVIGLAAALPLLAGVGCWIPLRGAPAPNETIERTSVHNIGGDHANLPPLHRAVLKRSTRLVEDLLKEGANPRRKAEQPGEPVHGLDAFDYARYLRIQGSDSEDEASLNWLLGIEKLLCDDPSVNQHAVVGTQNINVNETTHQVLFMDALGEENQYPADNYDVLQGVVEGPLGVHPTANIALVGVWAFENVGLPCEPMDPQKPSDCGYDPRKAEAPSQLEAILSVSGDPSVDGDLGWTNTAKITSRRSTPYLPARLLGVDSLTIEDVDGDGQYEARTTARFALGCSGEPFTETIDLKIGAETVTPMETTDKASTPSTPAETKLDSTNGENHRCSATLWVVNSDPKGLNARATHLPDAPVTGTLPDTTEFKVINAKNNRIQFIEPYQIMSLKNPDGGPLKTGPQTGWVDGSRLFVDTMTRHPTARGPGELYLYTQTDLTSPRIDWGELLPSRGHAWPQIEKVLDCHGGWLKVEVLDDRKMRFTGWLHPENQCANQYTNCG